MTIMLHILNMVDVINGYKLLSFFNWVSFRRIKIRNKKKWHKKLPVMRQHTCLIQNECLWIYRIFSRKRKKAKIKCQRKILTTTTKWYLFASNQPNRTNIERIVWNDECTITCILDEQKKEQWTNDRIWDFYCNCTP